MQQYKKLATLAAIVGATALAGCASKQPAPTVVVVPPSQAQQGSQASAAIRSGTVVAAQNADGSTAASSQGTASSGASSSAGMTSAGGQILTIQFDDGQRQFYQLPPGSQQFQVGERVTVNTTQGMPLITR